MERWPSIYEAGAAAEFAAMKRSLEAKIKQAPPGYLRILNKTDTVTYQYRVEGSFLSLDPVKDEEQIRMLAQKGYDRKVLRLLGQLEKKARNVEAYQPKSAVMDLYDQLPPERRKYVDPVVLTDEEVTMQWLREEKVHRANGCADGEGAASRFRPPYLPVPPKRESDALIAENLWEFNIPFRYGPEIRFPSGEGICPTFQIFRADRRLEILWDHFDHLEQETEVRRMLERQKLYWKEGYRPGSTLICTMEWEDNGPLRKEEVREVVMEYLLGRRE